MKDGLAGKLARGFIDSKLTVLLMIVFMIIGVYSSFLIPREEEPQIEVPMADIFIGYPGASPREVESRIVKPLERLLSNIKGVEHVYSTSMQGQGMATVQFHVGEDLERSLVLLYDELGKHMDQMPSGASPPLVKSRAIDDVPIMALSLWSDRYDDFELRGIAEEVLNEMEKIQGVSHTRLIGGRSRQFRVVVDTDKLAGSGLDLMSLAQSIRSANRQMDSGNFHNGDTEFHVSTGKFLERREDLELLIVGTKQGRPIYLNQLATVIDGPQLPRDYLSIGFGRGSDKSKVFRSEYPAVTLSIAKRKGVDAMEIAEKVQDRVDHLQQNLIPDGVQVELTRNYGLTASEKVSELLMHLLGAILAVTLVVILAMGWRGGLVVFLSVPITFALTLLSYYLLDYTLNRITLFALVFVTGIVVDDSIIIAENMHRHFKMKRLPFKDAALFAINEVGNPTILATFTVIASVLPMAFVSGLMGPYMSPMPIGASIAMLFSLFVALTITPYLGYIFLREKDQKTERTKAGTEIQDSRIYKLYERFERPLLESAPKRWLFLGITVLLLIGSLALFATRSVVVKMLPFDNKNELQLLIDLPEGSSLERSSAVAREIGAYLSTREEVVSYQSYIGIAAPMTFNGLVRHYDLRGGSHTADIQINLIDKSERSLQSHDIAKALRPKIQELGDKYGANVKIVEVPPGPPVLSTIVAEVYGPDHRVQIDLAQQIMELLKQTPDVVDVDLMVEEPQPEYKFIIDRDKAALKGISPQYLVEYMALALGEGPVSHGYLEDSFGQVEIQLSLAQQDKASLEELVQLKVASPRDGMVSLGELMTVEEGTKAKSIYRKNQKRVVYVLSDMAGKLESPVYAILGMEDRLKELELPLGHRLEEHYIEQPKFEQDYGVKWDGEWQITLEVFRDLGIAFMGVLIIIYILIVGWFQNYRAPLVMMVAIPLSLIGIVLGHWVLGAFFTATSFIGMIALAGIMVRNSVLLIDFIRLRLDQGIPFKQAVLEAGAVRTTPILLTAGTVVIGAVVILFDPIFQGLAISLMGGTLVSTVLTLLIVPLVYYMIEHKKYK